MCDPLLLLWDNFLLMQITDVCSENGKSWVFVSALQQTKPWAVVQNAWGICNSKCHILQEKEQTWWEYKLYRLFQMLQLVIRKKVGRSIWATCFLNLLYFMGFSEEYMGWDHIHLPRAQSWVYAWSVQVPCAQDCLKNMRQSKEAALQPPCNRAW